MTKQSMALIALSSAAMSWMLAQGGMPGVGDGLNGASAGTSSLLGLPQANAEPLTLEPAPAGIEQAAMQPASEDLRRDRDSRRTRPSWGRTAPVEGSETPTATSQPLDVPPAP